MQLNANAFNCIANAFNCNNIRVVTQIISQLQSIMHIEKRTLLQALIALEDGG